MKKYIILIVLLTIFIVGCDNKDVSYSKKETITCSKKDQLLSDGAVLIDVRSKAEYDEKHLNLAINVPVEGIANEIKKYDTITKDTKIIVYCRSGGRSSEAAKILKDEGYKNVYDLGAMSNCE